MALLSCSCDPTVDDKGEGALRWKGGQGDAARRQRGPLASCRVRGNDGGDAGAVGDHAAAKVKNALGWCLLSSHVEAKLTVHCRVAVTPHETASATVLTDGISGITLPAPKKVVDPIGLGTPNGNLPGSVRRR